MTLTRQDATTVRALASLAKHVPPRMRAEHLIGKAEAVAAKIDRGVDLREAARKAVSAAAHTTVGAE